MEMSVMKNLKVASKYPRYNIRAKPEVTHTQNSSEVAKSHSFKLLRKSNVKNKSKDRRSLSGSNKTGRPATAGQTTTKKKIKTIKGKQLETKDNGGYFCIPQFPNNMHAAKALLEFKRKLKKSEMGECNEDAKEILKEYIRKFMKNTDYHKHFEPTVTKIINDYGLMSQNGEPIIENLIKLHLPMQQKESMTNSNQSKKLQRNYNKLHALFNSSKSSTNDSTYHKSRANSNEAHKQAAQYIPTYSTSGT